MKLEKRKILYYSATCGQASFTSINASVGTIYLLNKGFSVSELSLYYAVFLICSAICEYPSGVVADLLGRKKTYSLGSIMLSVPYMAYTLQISLVDLLLVGAIGGVGEAMVSGSLEAWLLHKKNTEAIKVISFGRSISKIVSILILVLLGSCSFNTNYVYYTLFYSSILLSLITFFTLKDNNYKKESDKNIVFYSISLFYKNKNVLLYSVISALAIGSLSAYIIFWQLLSEKNGFVGSEKMYVNAISLTAAAISSLYYATMTNYRAIDRLVKNILLLGISGLFLLLVNNVFSFLLGVALFGFSMGIFFPLMYQVISESIDADCKASLFSLSNFVGTVSAIICTLISGIVIENAGITFCIYFTIVLLLIGYAVAVYNPLTRVRPEAP